MKIACLLRVLKTCEFLRKLDILGCRGHSQKSIIRSVYEFYVAPLHILCFINWFTFIFILQKRRNGGNDHFLKSIFFDDFHITVFITFQKSPFQHLPNLKMIVFWKCSFFTFPLVHPNPLWNPLLRFHVFPLIVGEFSWFGVNVPRSPSKPDLQKRALFK